MAVFEGDWRNYPEMVTHVENLKLWVQTFGVARLIEPGENGCFPEAEARLLDDDATYDKLWTIYNGFSDGIWLVPSIEESTYSSSFVLTKFSVRESESRGMTLPSEFFDSVKGVWLSPRFECPECDDEDSSVEDCNVCHGDGSLDLYFDTLGDQGLEYQFPLGTYFNS